jgi:hypothetical protein
LRKSRNATHTSFDTHRNTHTVHLIVETVLTHTLAYGTSYCGDWHTHTLNISRSTHIHRCMYCTVLAVLIVLSATRTLSILYPESVYTVLAVRLYAALGLIPVHPSTVLRTVIGTFCVQLLLAFFGSALSAVRFSLLNCGKLRRNWPYTNSSSAARRKSE